MIYGIQKKKTKKMFGAFVILLEEDSFVEFDRMAFDETWHNT